MKTLIAFSFPLSLCLLVGLTGCDTPQQNLADAEKNLQETRAEANENVGEAVVDANKDIHGTMKTAAKDVSDEVVDAEENVADAVDDAHENVAEAKKDVIDAKVEMSKEAADAKATLDKARLQYANDLTELEAAEKVVGTSATDENKQRVEDAKSKIEGSRKAVRDAELAMADIVGPANVPPASDPRLLPKKGE